MEEVKEILANDHVYQDVIICYFFLFSLLFIDFETSLKEASTMDMGSMLHQKDDQEVCGLTMNSLRLVILFVEVLDIGLLYCVNRWTSLSSFLQYP